MQIKNLSPVLSSGILPAFGGSILLVSKTFEFLVLAMLFPYLNQKSKIKTIYLSSILLISLLLTITSFSILTVMGPGATTRSYPFMSMMRLINVGDFIERVESVHFAIWLLALFARCAIYYYVIVLGLNQLFNLKTYKPLILPVGTLLIPLSLLVAPSVVELDSFTSSVDNFIYNFFYILLLPLSLLLIAVIRKKGVRSP